MDYLILGLLILKPRTLYEIRTKLLNEMNMLYSASTGSIQAAIIKLLNAAYIIVTERKEGNLLKKIYEPTEAGKNAFNEWVNGEFEAERDRNPSLLKIYFMGLSEASKRNERIENHIKKLEAQKEILNGICESGKTVEIPEQYKELAAYQLLTAKFGADMIDFQIKWFRENVLQFKK